MSFLAVQSSRGVEVALPSCRFCSDSVSYLFGTGCHHLGCRQLWPSDEVSLEQLKSAEPAQGSVRLGLTPLGTPPGEDWWWWSDSSLRPLPVTLLPCRQKRGHPFPGSEKRVCFHIEGKYFETWHWVQQVVDRNFSLSFPLKPRFRSVPGPFSSEKIDEMLRLLSEGFRLGTFSTSLFFFALMFLRI